MEAGVKSVMPGGDASPGSPEMGRVTGGIYWKKKGIKKARLENDYTDVFVNVHVADKKLLKLFSMRHDMTINALINEYIKYEIKNVNYIIGVDYDIIESVRELYDLTFTTRLHVRVKSKIAEKYDVNNLVRNIIEKFRREVFGR